MFVGKIFVRIRLRRVMFAPIRLFFGQILLHFLHICPFALVLNCFANRQRDGRERLIARNANVSPITNLLYDQSERR
jgi:hypothetical protein